MKRYYEEITFIRAIACLLVLLTHVTLMYPIENQNIGTKLSLVINQFARVGTPMFCIISAFLLFNGFKDKVLDHKKFIQSRTKKIVIPYLIWSVIYIVLMDITGKSEFDWQNIWKYLFLGDGYVHLYFIAIVLQFYIFFMMSYHLFNKDNIAKYTLLSVIIMIAWYIARDSSYAVNHRAFLLNWIGFFMMGGYMAYYLDQIKAWIGRIQEYLGYYVIIGLMLLFVEMNIPHLFTSDRMMNIILVPLAIAFIIYIYWHSNKFIVYLLNYIGNRAMGIYLVHMLVIGVLGELIPISFWNPYMLLFNYILVVVVTLITVDLLSLLPKGEFLFPVAKSPGQDETLWRKIIHFIH
ncbi:acyltransferase family protein [Macrococcus animalis]|uniref:acyltransferase family protein n=1 Tax=Macrococcus animalis TaxID=3395467 RepID=UPI0039BDDEDE